MLGSNALLAACTFGSFTLFAATGARVFVLGTFRLTVIALAARAFVFGSFTLFGPVAVTAAVGPFFAVVLVC